MESLNYRCQRVPCHTICPNENILLPRLRHTRVQKIQKLIEGETLEGGSTVDKCLSPKAAPQGQRAFRDRIVVPGSH
jgi:hypothetical protein